MSKEASQRRVNNSFGYLARWVILKNEAKK